jgi:hypothetical protein
MKEKMLSMTKNKKEREHGRETIGKMETKEKKKREKTVGKARKGSKR